MYFYLYDSFLQSKQYTKELAKIEARITDLGIRGHIAKLNILKDIGELIRDAVKRGTDTVVVLGDDQTVSKAINVVAQYNIVLGVIPIGEGSHNISRTLGIHPLEAACDEISRRMIAKIDLGLANDYHFIYSLEAQSPNVVLKGEGGFQIKPLSPSSRVMVCNFNCIMDQIGVVPRIFNPQDGKLEAIITPAVSQSFFSKIFQNQDEYKNIENFSILPLNQLRIESSSDSPIIIMADGKKVLKTPVEVSVIPEKLRVIVGRERGF